MKTDEKIDIKALRLQSGLTQQELSDLTGIPRGRIAQWELRGTEPKLADYQKLLIALNATNVARGTKKEGIDKISFIESDDPTNVVIEPPQPNFQQQLLEKKLNRNKRIPFYDAEAAAGITQTEMTPIHAPAGTIDVGDLLHDADAAIRIYGNSMNANYPPGCVVALIKCTSVSIEPGEVYVIETRDRRLLKRLYYENDEPNGDSFMCYSDNIMKFEGGARNGKLAYPPFMIHKKEIINLFMVAGVIKRNSNSVIINR